MNKGNVIYLVECGCGCVSAIGFRDGMPLGTFIKGVDKISKKELVRIVVARFNAQFMQWKREGHKQNTAYYARLNWEIVYMSIADVVNKTVVDLPKVDKVVKPKIYEIKEQGDGFMVVKHDRELMDEDEVKLKLFAKCVNE